MPKRYKIIFGKRYEYRASYPKQVANKVAKELRERGLRVHLVKERKKVLGVLWYEIWQRHPKL